MVLAKPYRIILHLRAKPVRFVWYACKMPTPRRSPAPHSSRVVVCPAGKSDWNELLAAGGGLKMQMHSDPPLIFGGCREVCRRGL